MKNLEAHQYRLLNERIEVRDRLDKLLAFIRSPDYAGICHEERERLGRQADHMADYLSVLNERIAAIEA